MLMALDIPLPKQIFGHPWILFNKEKMSKSKGNVLYTDDLVRHYGVDATRYFVLHEIPFAQDGNLTNELMIERTNTDLANTLGNLVNRTITMQRKYFPGGVTHRGIINNFDRELVDKCYETRSRVDRYMDSFKVSDAMEEIMNLLRRANKYIDENEPWKLAKDEFKQDELENVLYNLLETIRYAATLLQSFIPTTANEMFNQLNVNLRTYESLSRFAKVERYSCNEPKILFARIDVEKKIAELMAEREEAMKALEPVVEEAKPAKVYAPVKETIAYDDFLKLDLVVGKIMECKKHPNADKLLISQVDIGSEVRQVISGIAKYYKPEELVGKKVIVVRNLKEANLRGEKSYGMILCASDKENDLLEIIEINGLEPGDIVS
jgi:methionyl-tRNA synthetase